MVGRWGRPVAALLVLALAAGCGDDGGGGGSSEGPDIGGAARPTGEEAWPAPPADRVAALVEAAGERLEAKESLFHHVHAHLDVFIDGEHRTVPAGLGLVISDPGVHAFDDLGGRSYGGIEQCDQPCISPLHTHDSSGVLHTESAVQQDNTLGQVFVEWDVRLDERCIGDFCAPDTSLRAWVDGEELPWAEVADIPLTDGKEIALVIGELPDRIPSEGDFSAA